MPTMCDTAKIGVGALTLAHALQPSQVGLLQGRHLYHGGLPVAPGQLCKSGGSADGAGVAAAQHRDLSRFQSTLCLLCSSALGYQLLIKPALCQLPAWQKAEVVAESSPQPVPPAHGTRDSPTAISRQAQAKNSHGHVCDGVQAFIAERDCSLCCGRGSTCQTASC